MMFQMTTFYLLTISNIDELEERSPASIFKVIVRQQFSDDAPFAFFCMI